MKMNVFSKLWLVVMILNESFVQEGHEDYFASNRCIEKFVSIGNYSLLKIDNAVRGQVLWKKTVYKTV